jgi:hypothetical protein
VEVIDTESVRPKSHSVIRLESITSKHFLYAFVSDQERNSANYEVLCVLMRLLATINEHDSIRKFSPVVLFALCLLEKSLYK